jgi:hypothetical protein
LDLLHNGQEAAGEICMKLKFAKFGEICSYFGLSNLKCIGDVSKHLKGQSELQG